MFIEDKSAGWQESIRDISKLPVHCDSVGNGIRLPFVTDGGCDAAVLDLICWEWTDHTAYKKARKIRCLSRVDS